MIFVILVIAVVIYFLFTEGHGKQRQNQSPSSHSSSIHSPSGVNSIGAPKTPSSPPSTYRPNRLYSPPATDQTSRTFWSRGKVSAQVLDCFPGKLDCIHKHFIALHFETTGLDADKDRIIEIGAVEFVNREKRLPTFSTFVKATIRNNAEDINHISEKELACAPSEEDALSELAAFIGEALQGKVPLCVHYSPFAIIFLCNALSRHGYSAEIRFVDTCSLSKIALTRLRSYRLDNVGRHLGLGRSESRRAVDRAEKCGCVLCRL